MCCLRIYQIIELFIYKKKTHTHVNNYRKNRKKIKNIYYIKKNEEFLINIYILKRFKIIYT